jgi:hypothetical protein
VEGWQLPLFTVERMYQELKLFQHWFLQNHLGLALTSIIEKQLDEFFYFLAESAAGQPQVFMHRDYHAANLMLLEDDQIGILDFQDAFIGPLTYDLVSLLRDCYIAWPEESVMELALQYHGQLGLQLSRDEFLRWFDWMGLQRHLKALLTFSRKYRRDGNNSYLSHIPRVLNYLSVVSERYEECGQFYQFLRTAILPAAEEQSLCVA